jgi:hypothetical protein
MLVLVLLCLVLALVLGPALVARHSGVERPTLAVDAGTYANFIAEIWSRATLNANETALVFGPLCNRDYEGEITQGGDTVRINTIGDPTIKTYDRTVDIDAPETLPNAQQTLTVDQEKYFNFKVSNIDKVQMNTPVMEKATSRAGYRQAKVADAFIAALMTSGVSADNTLSDVDASGSASAVLVYEALVQLGVVLSEADVPDDERWAVISPAAHGKLQLDDRFVSFGTGPNGAVLANGKIGRAAGFTIYVSNQLVVDASGHPTILAGHPYGTSFAQQLVDVKAYEPERGFDDAVKGLQVYGAKVTKPDHLAKVELTL